MSKGKNVIITNLNEHVSVQMLPNVFRTTLAYNEKLMLCHFSLKKDSNIPLHNHRAAQIGYVIKGKIRFFTKDNDNLLTEAGSSYIFDCEEYHGAQVLEDSEIIECFSPIRQEYIDC